MTKTKNKQYRYDKNQATDNSWNNPDHDSKKDNVRVVPIRLKPSTIKDLDDMIKDQNLKARSTYIRELVEYEVLQWKKGKHNAVLQELFNE